MTDMSATSRIAVSGGPALGRPAEGAGVAGPALTAVVPGIRRAALVMLTLAFGSAVAAGGPAPFAALAQQRPAAGATAPQPVDTTEGEERLTQAQLEQLLAPVALYPDSLLAQVLMASTYPLEVVQAQRWLGKGTNAQLKGEPLAKALEAESWDPSVKSLAPFPDVLKLLNDQLEWTQRLGDAVLAQQADVLNAVQALRGRAQAAGALASNPQQTVTVTQNAAAAVPGAGAPAPAVPPPLQVIAIEPAQPDMVYVPAYDPAVVYGPWPYPTYPPPYYPPPPAYGVGAALLTGMAFAGGAAIVGSLWGWGRPAWGRGDVDVNVNRYNNINANRTQISGNAWQHDVSHRHGVAYRNSEVTNRFRGGERATQAQGRERFRGRVDQAGLGARPAGGPGLGDRRSGGADGAGLADRRPAGNRGPATARPSGSRPSLPAASSNARPAPAPQALQGIGQGDRTRAAAQRGQASRQASAVTAGRGPVARLASAGGRDGSQALAARGGAGAGGRQVAAGAGRRSR